MCVCLPQQNSSMGGKLGCVVVAVDGSEVSMNALEWALQNVTLRSPSPDSPPGAFLILHVQPPPSIAAGLNPGAIPFGGPCKNSSHRPFQFLPQSLLSISTSLFSKPPAHVEVPAFAAAIEAHQKRISQAIIDHALQICAEKNVVSIDHLGPSIICSLLEDVKTQVVVGDPKEVICEVTANLNADLLVMGSRDFGAIKR
ncbi:hypothetical protein ACLOJK_013578 [Asimina triloba]